MARESPGRDLEPAAPDLAVPSLSSVLSPDYTPLNLFPTFR